MSGVPIPIGFVGTSMIFGFTFPSHPTPSIATMGDVPKTLDTDSQFEVEQDFLW